MHPSDDPTIVAVNVSKQYQLPSSSFFSPFKKKKTIQALKEMSLVTYAGESVGILGKNGSGKSTLLNIIAGNQRPTTGKLPVSEAPTLLGISAALQPHLTGITNVRLGLLAMGMHPTEVDSLQDEILDWAELSDARDRPLRTYSSGMQARLKFAIATSVKRKILLVDEALSAGDATFAEKAQARMDSFIQDAGTVVVVSHTPGVIEEHCSRAIWLHEGELIADYRTARTVKYYKAWTRYAAKGNERAANRIINQMRDEFTPQNVMFDSVLASILDEHSDFNFSSP